MSLLNFMLRNTVGLPFKVLGWTLRPALRLARRIAMLPLALVGKVLRIPVFIASKVLRLPFRLLGWLLRAPFVLARRIILAPLTFVSFLLRRGVGLVVGLLVQVTVQLVVAFLNNPVVMSGLAAGVAAIINPERRARLVEALGR